MSDSPVPMALVDPADLRSAMSLIRGVSLPLDMEPWRDGLLRRLEKAVDRAVRVNDLDAELAGGGA